MREPVAVERRRSFRREVVAIIGGGGGRVVRINLVLVAARLSAFSVLEGARLGAPEKAISQSNNITIFSTNLQLPHPFW